MRQWFEPERQSFRDPQWIIAETHLHSGIECQLMHGFMDDGRHLLRCLQQLTTYRAGGSHFLTELRADYQNSIVPYGIKTRSILKTLFRMLTDCRVNELFLCGKDQHRQMTGAGLKIASSVTKKLDLLVVADPDTQSGKAKKARDYGIRVMSDTVFWRHCGIEVG